MIKNPWPGVFVVIEGIDYCGKGTQLHRLEIYLKAYTERRFLITKEPTNEYYGKCIRRVLGNGDLFMDVSGSALQTLFAVDSREHMENKVIPALKDDKLVVSDRYRISSIVYGSGSEDQIRQYYILNELILGESFLWPDLIIYLDITAEESMIRKAAANRKVHEGFEELDKLRRIRKNYLYMVNSNQFPNFYLVNGKGKEEDIFAEIKSKIHEVANIKEA